VEWLWFLTYEALRRRRMAAPTALTPAPSRNSEAGSGTEVGLPEAEPGALAVIPEVPEATPDVPDAALEVPDPAPAVPVVTPEVPGAAAEVLAVAPAVPTELPAVPAPTPAVPVDAPAMPLVRPAVLPTTLLLPVDSTLVLDSLLPLLLATPPLRVSPLRMSLPPSPAGHQEGTILHETPASAAVAPSTINPLMAINSNPWDALESLLT